MISKVLAQLPHRKPKKVATPLPAPLPHNLRLVSVAEQILWILHDMHLDSVLCSNEHQKRRVNQFFALTDATQTEIVINVCSAGEDEVYHVVLFVSR